ncbi:MAG: hypothetical protein U1D35_05030 [Paracoccaceae bacterium]|nr:hypothetical protein [Paracoccaceae bacterium]
MDGQLMKAVLFGLWLATGLASPLSAAGWDELDLGEATVSIAHDWQMTDQRRDAEAVYAGPNGASLRVFWWFPDEPLLGYDDEISHQTRSFPVGPALVVRSRIAGRSVVLAAFERENADRERLLFLIESDAVSPEALEAALDPILQKLRFKGDPEPVTQAPIAAPVVDAADGAGSSAPSPVTFDAVLAALATHYGGDCAPVDPPGLPATAVLTALALPPEAAALCGGQDVSILALRLPQDPRMGQAGLLGMVYLRGFLAQGKKPLVLVDLAHGALVTVTAASGAGITVAVSDLADLAPANSGSDALPALDAGVPAKTQLFSGEMTKAWLPHAVRGGKFDDWARFGAGAFSVDVPSQANFGTTGLMSAESVVSLPSPDDLQSVRLRFDFDTQTINNAVFALVPADGLGKLDWDVAEIWVAVEQKRDAAPQLVLAVQRQVQARFNITDRDDLAGLTLEMRPDGMILLINAADRVLLEGRMEARPLAADLHLQVSATSPGHQVPARLDLRGITLERAAFVPNDPAALLRDAAQSITLFDGQVLGPNFAFHNSPRGADFSGKLRIAGGLRVDSPQGDGLNGLGIYAPQPIVWLDRFGKGASARLRFEFDPALTSGFQLALGSTFTYADADPGLPRFVLDWHRMADGTIKAGRWIDRELDRLDVTPATMPAVVELVLTPEGVQVLAEGFPDDVLAWDALREGQGFRLYAIARAETKADPVAMALDRITLTRTPQTDNPLAPAPMPGVEPLPVSRHFPNPQAPWEPYGLAGLTFDEAGRFDAAGAVIVDVAAKYEGGRAGVLSAAPVAVLDERIDKTPYRLTLRFDPALTDGLEVMLSNHKATDMWKGSEAALSLVRQSGGREAGSYVLTLTKDYYAYWIRRISAQDMARWDGTMLLDLSPDTLTLTLPDVVTHRGTGFVGIAKEAAFHMVVQSLSDTKYGAARMTLRQVDGQWLMPRMMGARERMVLTDGADFDAEAYLDLLGAEFGEDIQ